LSSRFIHRIMGLGLFAFLHPVLGQDTGARVYEDNCAVCHDGGMNRAPTRELFEVMPAERVLESLENGSMLSMAVTLSAMERRAVSEYLTGRRLGEPLDTTPRAAAMCGAAAEPFDPSRPSWMGWGGSGTTNLRFQPQESAGIAVTDVPRLRLKWAFGMPGHIQAYGNPAVAGGRVFFGSQGGIVYSLDAATGCVHWYFEAPGFVRTGISLGEIDSARGPRLAVFFGDGRASAHALDAVSGEPIWRTQVDDYPVARVTGSPALHEGRLYVPVASGEEAAGSDPQYECCRFRGSLVALDAATGEQLWKTYTVEVPEPTIKNDVGVQLWGPSGAPIWSSPAIDPVRNAVYVTTGNNYSDPTSEMSDAFVAMDLDTGEVLWYRQMTERDAYVAACRLEDKTNCAESDGPDVDFGASPILIGLGERGRMLVAGQKSGVVHALDPDNEGAVLWQTRIGRGGSMGGVQWGSAADSQNVYVALSDIGRLPVEHSWATEADPEVGGGMFALRIIDGAQVWYTPPASCGERVRCSPAQSAAVTAIPGIAFSGSVDGHLRAYSTVDGRIVWDFDTVRAYDTVNGVEGQGGSLDGPGPVVADGMLFVNSGYPTGGGMPGNVLLAFSVDGQ
jgi:polyvinyl alcohol dehydrogenase (cytochrome)